MNPTSMTQDQFLTTLRYVITTSGGWLAGKGYISGDTLAAILTLTMMVGPWLWGLYSNSLKEKQAQLREAVAVQAGVNLVATGKAVTDSGAIVDKTDGTTPPKPVTVETAKEIIKDFAPAPSDLAKK